MAAKRTIAASEFKAKCLALLDEVAETKETLVVTKRGKPVVQVVPVEEPRSLLALDAPVRAWVREALALERIEPMALTAEVALDAAQLQFEANPADRIIYATARAADAQLVTRDERMRAFDPEMTVW